MQSELKGIRKAIDELQVLITEKEIELFVLLKDRELGLSNLQVERQAQLGILEKGRDSEMTLVERERDFYMDGLVREKDSAQVTYETLADKYESARAGQSGTGGGRQDRGALAVAPERPMGRRTMLNTPHSPGGRIDASVELAFVLEYAQTISVAESPEREIEVSPSGSLEFESDSPSATRRKLAGIVEPKDPSQQRVGHTGWPKSLRSF